MEEKGGTAVRNLLRHSPSSSLRLISCAAIISIRSGPSPSCLISILPSSLARWGWMPLAAIMDPFKAPEPSICPVTVDTGGEKMASASDDEFVSCSRTGRLKAVMAASFEVTTPFSRSGTSVNACALESVLLFFFFFLARSRSWHWLQANRCSGGRLIGATSWLTHTNTAASFPVEVGGGGVTNKGRGGGEARDG